MNFNKWMKTFRFGLWCPGFLHKVEILSMILLVSMVLIGCPHSKLYRGLSEVEQDHFSKANREIYPNDVRSNFQQYSSSKVAWPGLITEGKWVEKDGTFSTTFMIEHHYYDWILDYSIQKEKFFLSPRGEGAFKTICPSKPEQESQASNTTGDLLIVYGTPNKIEDGMVFLTCDHARLIKREWVRTDVFEYGRPGEPVRFLNVPGPGAGTILRKNSPQ